MTLRIRQIALVAAGLGPVVEALETRFGLAVAFRDPVVARWGLENAVLPVGDQFLEVVAPIRSGTSAGRYLDRRGGPGGYMVILQSGDHARSRRRVDELGIRIAFEHVDEGYHCLQLHPGDTGGALLEIDRAEDKPDGAWAPAGPDWQAAKRTEVVRAIAAAELQSDSPERLARRWSEVTGVSIRPGPSGAPEIPLEGGVLRFVRADDGRGEGLGGVDLVASTSDRPADESIGGLRFRCVPPAS